MKKAKKIKCPVCHGTGTLVDCCDEYTCYNCQGRKYIKLR